MNTTAPALHLEDVTRAFGTRASGRVTNALRGISLTVQRGQVVCLLGPNGAGKTTTVKIAATLLEPTSGLVEVCGVDAVAHSRRARMNVGLVLGGDRGFYLRASAVENLRFFAELQGVTGRHRDGRITALLETVGLGEHGRERVETFSRGMRQRLHIARALLAEPGLILLDEPSLGLDPQGAQALRSLVRELRATGHGVVLTTHYLAEAEELADVVHVVTGGVIAATGAAQAIAVQAGVVAVTDVTLRRAIPDAAGALDRLPDASSWEVNERHGTFTATITWTSDGDFDARVRGAIDPQLVHSMSHRAPTLEEAYLAFVAQRPGGSKAAS